MKPPASYRRGPAPIIIIATIVLLLVLCWVFGRGCSGSQRAKENEALQNYTTAVNKLVQRSAAVATQFNNLKGSVKGAARDDVDRQLGQMQGVSESIARDSEKVVVPSKTANLQPLLRLSFNLRAQGVGEFRTGIVDAIDKKDPTAAVQSMSKGLTDLVVADQVFQSFSSQLGSKLKSAKLDYVKVSDAGQFVPKIDDATTAAIGQYLSAQGISSALAQTGTSQTGATNTPAQAMRNYLKNQGTDTSSATFAVVSDSKSDPNWKLDSVTLSGGNPKYFILHNTNGSWTVVDYGASFTAAQIKASGAPSDLTPP